MVHDTINILGAGISGLTAAINLAKEGYDVTVYEILSDVGKKHKLNFEGLENWTKDMKELLKKTNIGFGFRAKQMNEVEWYSPSFRKVKLKCKKPLFYLVERGGRNSFEYYLKRKASQYGVKFNFNSSLKMSEADIVSTGVKYPTAHALGCFFDKVKSEDKVLGILSDDIAPKGYFYLIVWNGKACVVTCSSKVRISKGLHDKNLRLPLIKDIIKGARLKHYFSGFANAGIPKTAIKDNILYTGEAAGFQDCMFGFGMKYAIESGYLAAKAIIDNISYDDLWKNAFKREIVNSSAIRFLLNTWGNKGYEKIINHLHGKDTIKALKLTYRRKSWKNVLLSRTYRFFYDKF